MAMTANAGNMDRTVRPFSPASRAARAASARLRSLVPRTCRQDRVAVRADHLAAQCICIIEISGLTDAAQRLHQIGEPPARERVSLHVPGHFAHDGTQSGVGFSRRDLEGLGQDSNNRSAVDVT